MSSLTSCSFPEMREARAALGLGCCVQLAQRSGKDSGFLGGEHIGQVFVKGRFDLCLGGSQAFRLFGGVQQLAAPVAGGISADQKTLCFQIFVRRAMAALSACSSSASCACVQPG